LSARPERPSCRRTWHDAAERNILDCIAYLRTQPCHDIWLSRPGSRKSYALTPDPEQRGRFAVLIREAYRSDAGQRRTRDCRVVVEVTGIDPLPAATAEQPDLI